MALVDNLKPNDVIAFEFNHTFNGEPKIEVAPITAIHGEVCVVHFLHGHKALSENIPKDEVIAIGDMENGTEQIEGWSGNFMITQPDHHLLKNK